MNAGATVPPRGRAAPIMVLCRQCLHYVFEATVTCPHCGKDARAVGERYRNGGYLGIETIQRIERIRDAAVEADRDKTP